MVLLAFGSCLRKIRQETSEGAPVTSVVCLNARMSSHITSTQVRPFGCQQTIYMYHASTRESIPCSARNLATTLTATTYRQHQSNSNSKTPKYRASIWTIDRHDFLWAAETPGRPRPGSRGHRYVGSEGWRNAHWSQQAQRPSSLSFLRRFSLSLPNFSPNETKSTKSCLLSNYMYTYWVDTATMPHACHDGCISFDAIDHLWPWVHPGMRIHLSLCGCNAVIYAPMEVKKV